MNILLIGSSGQLGVEFLSIDTVNQFNIQSPTSKELDITSKSDLQFFFNKLNPDIVLNFSAYTNVEKAETEPNKADNINNLGVNNLVELSNTFNSLLIHISTDYVFGAEGEGPFDASSLTSPINQYGKSKDDGEKKIIKNSNNSIIIRTASLYGLYGNNFFKKFISQLQKNKVINAISDHKISITYSFDLAVFILNLILDYQNNVKNNLFIGVNILHIINNGFTSWFEVAKVIADELKKDDIESSIYKVNAISSDNWTSVVTRPTDSRLQLSSIDHLADMPNWETSLRSACKNFLTRGND